MVSLAIVDAIELESETGKITQIEAIEKLLRTIESCELRKKLAPSLPPISTPGPKALPANNFFGCPTDLFGCPIKKN